MNHQNISSALLSSAGYDPATKVMEIVFARGGRYAYAEVPPEAWDAFIGAESKGKHFLSDIKGKYEFTKVVEEEEKDDA